MVVIVNEIYCTKCGKQIITLRNKDNLYLNNYKYKFYSMSYKYCGCWLKDIRINNDKQRNGKNE